MKETQLNRIIRLIRRTGDKAVVLDQSTDHVLVMMSVDDYEGLVDQRDDSLDFLPPDQGAEPLPETIDFSEFDGKAETKTTAATATAVRQEAIRAEEKSKLDFSSDWAQANAKTTIIAPHEEVSLEDVPNEEEEEKFYLEPVE